MKYFDLVRRILNEGDYYHITISLAYVICIIYIYDLMTQTAEVPLCHLPPEEPNRNHVSS